MQPMWLSLLLLLMLPFTRIQYIKYSLKCVETVPFVWDARRLSQKLRINAEPNPNDESHAICIATQT